MTATWVYVRADADLYTVGHYAPDGQWQAESDHGSPEGAAARCHFLNGGGDLELVAACTLALRVLERHCAVLLHLPPEGTAFGPAVGRLRAALNPVIHPALRFRNETGDRAALPPIQ